MNPPHVDSVEPRDGATAEANTVVFRGNLLGLPLKERPPVVREEPGGAPLPCRWTCTAQVHHPPEGMVGGATPSVLTVWFPARCAGKTLSATYLGTRSTFTVADPVREVPVPPDALPPARGGLLGALRRLFSGR